MALTLTAHPVTPYPIEGEWFGTFDLVGDYVLGGALWEKPMQFFKTLDMAHMEHPDGYIFEYDRVTKKVACLQYGGMEYPKDDPIDVTVHWFFRGRHQ